MPSLSAGCINPCEIAQDAGYGWRAPRDRFHSPGRPTSRDRVGDEERPRALSLLSGDCLQNELRDALLGNGEAALKRPRNWRPVDVKGAAPRHGFVSGKA